MKHFHLSCPLFLVLFHASLSFGAALPPPPRLVMPPVIYAVNGIESNIYFENIVLVLDRSRYVFDVSCDKGSQYDERWTIKPTDKDAPGDYPMEVVVRDESNAIVGRAKSILRIVPADKPSPKPMTVLTMGDSLTQASVYPQHLLDLAEADPQMDLKLIGCRGANNEPASGPLRHEGYNGWSAESFCTHMGKLARTGKYIRPDTGSPFVYDVQGKPELDMTRYFQEFNDGKAPDAVTILLGSNDVFGANDDNIDEQVERMLKHYDMLVAGFRKAGPDTAIGVVVATPPSFSQDGFRNYNGPRRLSRWQCKRNNHRLVEAMLQRYGGRESEKIFLIPANCNLDTEDGFPMRSGPRSARSTTQQVRTNNGSHPSPTGYNQFGDSIYCWLKSLNAAQK